MTWRDRFRPIIGGVLAEVGAGDMKKLRKALREAWPYTGTKPSWLSQVWYSEINIQLGKRPKLGRGGRKPGPKVLAQPHHPYQVQKRRLRGNIEPQLKLF